MARVQLELPEKFFYSTTMQVRFTDVTPSGHVGNDQMISLLSSARYSFFSTWAWKTPTMWEAAHW
jgi:acyl-CoA thioesterase FadM